MYKITCIHPTCRPEMARKTRSKWLKLCDNSKRVQYITCFDSKNKHELLIRKKKRKNIIELYENYSFGIVKKCNYAANFATSNCIIVATDDTIPEKGWDTKILHSIDWSKEIVLNVSDGTESVDQRAYMVKTVIMSKKRYNNLGYILHPDFKHVYCDNYHSWISHRDNVVLDRKNILFEHFHPSLGKSDPDEFYINASTLDEYIKGQKIFLRLTKENLTSIMLKKLVVKYKNEINPILKDSIAFVILAATGKLEKDLTKLKFK